MPVVDVKNLEGKKVGTVELADDVFSVKVNEKESCAPAGTNPTAPGSMMSCWSIRIRKSGAAPCSSKLTVALI